MIQKKYALRHLKVATLILGALTLPVGFASAQGLLPTSYSVIDLGSLGGDAQATAISSNGLVTGYSNTTGKDALGNSAARAFVYNGSLSPIGTVGGTSSFGTAINASGQVAGYAQLPGDSSQRAFLYNGSNTLNLGTLSGGSGDTNPAFYSAANGINNAGEVVGNSSAGTAGHTVQHAFLYSTSTLHDIGTLGGNESNANGIDSLGRVAGDSTTTAAGTATHAFIWVPTTPGGTTGTMVDFGLLAGSYSSAAALNTPGNVVGTFTVGQDLHAFRTAPLTPANPLTDDLGTLGGTYSSALAINTVGTTVGFSAVSGDLTTHAFVFTNGMTDLNTLMDPTTGVGWILSDATGINDAGQIVGFGIHNGLTRAFLLTPAPEPSSLAVFAMGIGAIGSLIARKRRPAA